MVATMTFVPRHGTRLRRGDARAWEQRPLAKVIVTSLGGSPTTDYNNRSVFAAEERRHR
jgi:hypothetical protein